jgi:hypothetical protein
MEGQKMAAPADRIEKNRLRNRPGVFNRNRKDDRVYQRKHAEQWLKEVSMGGRMILLGDRSIWEIPSKNMGDTVVWHLASKISVIDGDDPAYPYKLINKACNEAVDARFLGI